MSAQIENQEERIRQITLKLLRPYTIRSDSPYLSEDQQRLSRIPLQKRSAWMAEWLIWATDKNRDD